MPVSDRDDWDNHKAILKARKPFADFIYKRPDPDGTLHYISSSGKPVFDDQGQFQGYHGIDKDVTALIQMELRLSIEHGVTHILAESNSIAEAAPQIIRVICETLGWSCGARWVPDEESDAIRCAETWGIASAEIDLFLEVSRQLAPSTQRGGLNRRAWVKGEPLWIQDVTQDKTFRRGPDAQNAGLHSAIAFPIKVGKKSIGVLDFFSREILQPNAQLLNATRYIGSQIGQFMQRKQAEEELRESEEHFRAVVDSANEGILVYDRSLNVISGNVIAERIIGLPLADLMGAAGFTSLLPCIREDGAPLQPEDRPTRITIQTGSPLTGQILGIKRSDGTISWLSVNTGFLYRPGESDYYGVVSNFSDITVARREAQLLALEHAVNRSLTDAESVHEAMKLVIRHICETEGWGCGRYLRVDELAGMLRFCEAWSVPSAEIERYIEDSRGMVYGPGVGLVGRVWQSGQPLWVADIGQDTRVARTALARETGMHGAFAVTVLFEGKTIGVLIFHSREIRKPDERLLQAISVIGSQIGQFLQRKHAEDVLCESEERFRSLTSLSSDWFWEQDVGFRFTRLKGMPIWAQDSTSADEPGKSLAELGVEVEGGWAAHQARLEAHQPFQDVDMWQRSPQGQMNYMSVSGEPIFDDENRFMGYRGVGKNVTEQRRDGQLLALEHAVNRSLATANSASEAIQASIQAVCETEGWECGRYFCVEARAGVLTFAEAWGIADPVIQEFIDRSTSIVYEKGVGLMGRVWESGEPLWVADVTQDQRAAQQALTDAVGIRGGFVFPVISEGTTSGTLAFNSRAVRAPEQRLLEVVGVIGGQIGQFVQRKQAEEESTRLGRMFAALSATNNAILHASSPDELYQQVCDATVHGGKFATTTIFLVEAGTSKMKTMATTGKVSQQKPILNVSIDETLPSGQGLAGIAYRTQRPCTSNDFLNDARTQPWHKNGQQAGYRAAAALPLIQGGSSVGVILIHHDVLNAFDDEIVKLLERMAENVSFALDNFRHQAERQRTQERIEYLATHDGLTDLPNRSMFSQLMQVAIASAQRYQRHFAVLFIDLDRFKIINDTLGHDAGDTLLQAIAGRIDKNLRTSDVVARFGGDEFVVLLQEMDNPDHVATIARKLLSIILKPVIIQGLECRVTASIGISLYPTDAQDEQTLMKNADMAMYLAKEQGKNNFQFYSRAIKSQSLERLDLENNLRHALERNEFFLHYQAKLDLHTGVINGVEALLRWQHPELGLVSPLQFIPLAEETGLIVPIGMWVLRTACAQNVAWQEAGLAPVCMAVNLSPRQFTDDKLLSDIAAVLAETGLDPSLLELEITESMVMGSIERADEQLAAIKQLGVRLAIDDFGTGYSSLAQIKRYPIDTIKVDRSFIRDIPQDAEDKAITKAIIAMGQSLSLTVVAEGVETIEQLNFLREHGCDEMQGFYFSKPVTPDQFAELLRDHVAVVSVKK